MRAFFVTLPITVIACGGPAVAPAPSTSAPPPAESASAAPANTSSAASSRPTPAPPSFTTKALALPGATGAVSLDYLARDRSAGTVWVPAGGTASVDVIDTATGNVTRIQGFATVEREQKGQKRVVGPSSASIGDGVVYVGNRAGSEVCVVDATKLTLGPCTKLASSPDGIQYVASAKELWVTTPRDKTIVVLDATTPGKLAPKTKITLDGAPEGYAVDNDHGVFFTNLEDANKTLSIDIKTHKVTSTWDAGCGSDGPRGIAADGARGFAFVACTDHLEVLDTAHGGVVLSKLDTGAGVDNIDYLETRGEIYAVAGKAAMLSVAHVDDKGILALVASAPTSPGTRVVVAAADGTAYVADGALGRIFALTPAR